MEYEYIKSEKVISKLNLSEIKLPLYESLYNGNSIKSIIEIAEEYFKNPILLCDTSYNVIEISPLGENTVHDGIYGVRSSNDKLYMYPKVISFIEQHKVIEDIYRYPTALCTTFGHIENQWVLCAIRIQNIVIAHVGICYINTKAKEEDIELATVLAQVISIEMQKKISL